MFTTIEKHCYDQERALYGSRHLKLLGCRFEGPADGESALKECRDVRLWDCFFDLRYPFWHDAGVFMKNCTMTPNCRAAIWYSDNVAMEDCRLRGIKALRECSAVTMERCDVESAEFAWFNQGLTMTDCRVQGEYFALRCEKLKLTNVKLKGKYSFQYLTDSLIENCYLDTKDAFWHAKNVVVRNCTVKGEYLAWYCENVTFENCRIIGTQPLCYCKGLKLINCAMIDTDLSFERSQVEATLTEPILSIKNPRSGSIAVPAAGEVILDDPEAKAELIIG